LTQEPTRKLPAMLCLGSSAPACQLLCFAHPMDCRFSAAPQLPAVFCSQAPRQRPAFCCAAHSSHGLPDLDEPLQRCSGTCCALLSSPAAATSLLLRFAHPIGSSHGLPDLDEPLQRCQPRSTLVPVAGSQLNLQEADEAVQPTCMHMVRRSAKRSRMRVHCGARKGGVLHSALLLVAGGQRNLQRATRHTCMHGEAQLQCEIYAGELCTSSRRCECRQLGTDKHNTHPDRAHSRCRGELHQRSRRLIPSLEHTIQ
jgi:hypothetical protein